MNIVLAIYIISWLGALDSLIRMIRFDLQNGKLVIKIFFIIMSMYMYILFAPIICLSNIFKKLGFLNI